MLNVQKPQTIPSQDPQPATPFLTCKITCFWGVLGGPLVGEVPIEALNTQPKTSKPS